ncbi:MAG: phospho-2-dehydro-3-deoxyheptonate aldolase, partial [Deltaproteobacteria bacterium]|nr:phospho-2-dehydro-3-deoxyheptonate aldolase [Deltaproteobacteria bacterium]
MILVLQEGITPEEKDRIRTTLRGEGYIVREMVDSGRSLIGAIGEVTQNLDFFEGLPGVERVIPISTAFKLASRKIHPQDTLVQVGDAAIGGERIVVIAGPCAVESREQALATAREVKKYGAVLFRGGAFKPRTSPYSFQGLGEEGLKILAEIREELGLGVVTEITSPTQADMMMKYVDMVQVGARNMQNFELLKCVGRMGKPVLL